ncbi:unnamed protein product [Spirodela intermedia]|uniref:Uncharacterized protein n=1 Tax=Spirodela intermedia TaxID=51605 RepID=A0A7I8IDJ5_SPIIN|nr:unnamed protein product [Spirodela intermedia]CAA6655112.1 unnamed protein product [Spirodela intermedia]
MRPRSPRRRKPRRLPPWRRSLSPLTGPREHREGGQL